MKSVRMLATGAVALFVFSGLTAPVRACDDRFIKKCEAEAEAAFLAERDAATPAAPRRKSMRVRAAAPAVRPVVRHAAVPQVAPAAPAATKPNDAFRLASEEASAPAAPESPLLRRFRGFIDPQPMTVNSFEALRRPQLDAQHLTPAPAMPTEEVAVAADDEIVVAEVPSEAAVPPAPNAAAPAAASPAPAVAPAAQPAPPVQAVPAPTEATAAPSDAPGGFPLAKLALTLCAALGVASALRFIVRA
jgi:hypothetical protein